jgi:hypothetical protein
MPTSHTSARSGTIAPTCTPRRVVEELRLRYTTENLIRRRRIPGVGDMLGGCSHRCHCRLARELTWFLSSYY